MKDNTNKDEKEKNDVIIIRKREHETELLSVTCKRNIFQRFLRKKHLFGKFQILLDSVLLRII